MKIGIVIGSPKVKKSNSEFLANRLKENLSEEHEFYEIIIPRRGKGEDEEYAELLKCQALIFFFPIYCDGIPAHMLSYLTELEQVFKGSNEHNVRVYAFTNCGFYRGECGKIAIEMMKIWTQKAGLIWGQGIGLGAGEMLYNVEDVPLGHGPNQNLGKLMNQLVQNIEEQKSDTDRYASPNFPRFLYEIYGELSWIRQCKKDRKNIGKLFITTSRRRIK